MRYYIIDINGTTSYTSFLSLATRALRQVGDIISVTMANGTLSPIFKNASGDFENL